MATSAGAHARAATIRPHVISDTPLALGAAESLGADPLIVYAPDDGYTYVAWNASDNTGIDLCVVPAGGTACEDGGPQLLTDPVYNSVGYQPTLAGLNELSNGDIVVLGADAAGGAGTDAWLSAEGGAAFVAAGNGLQNGGQDISPVSLYYTQNNVAPLSAADLGLLDNYGNYFADSPVSGPESPSSIASPDTDTAGTYDRKSLEVIGSEVAAEPDPAAGGDEVVVGIGDTFASGDHPSGCAAPYLATGYGTAVGTVGGTGGGTLNHAGLAGYSMLTCEAEAPVLAFGGGAGIGAVEEEGTGASYPGVNEDLTVDWRAFTPTATGGGFGSPVQIANISTQNLAGAEDFDAAEDGASGVYVSWVDQQGLVLSYSPNAGATWDGANPIKGVGSAGSAQGTPAISAIGNGLGELAYEADTGSGNQIYLQVVSFIPPQPTTLTTAQPLGTVLSAANLQVPDGTTGETDRATLSGTNVPTATGTVTYSLYSDNTCSSSHLETSSTATVAGATVPVSSPVTKKLKPGTYYWQAAYGGDEFNQASTSSCGSEKLTVAPVTAPSSAATSGSTVTLPISCAGPCTIKATITLPSGGTARAGDSKKLIKLTSGKFTLKGKKGGKDKLRLKWNSYARKVLKHDHDKLTTLLQMTVKAGKSRYGTDSPLKLRK
ncbi:MAG TPA: hypothetical protein VHU61_09700 [Solirubrobacteraceae bacterium]|nr:hypothetical protein [Solirubrobacteraceae bacterium]